jgi:hypothetical protein
VEEPSLPDVIGRVVTGFIGLDDFRPIHPRRTTSRQPNSVRPLRTQYTNPQTGSISLAPSDIATIYDLNPLYQNGIDGTGQSLVVVGQTNVDLDDVYP